MDADSKGQNRDLGRQAERPSQIPKKGWLAIIKRVRNQFANDHLAIVAAGIAFYFFLALFPAIAAFVSIYGLVFSPAQAVSQVENLTTTIPGDAQNMLREMASGLANKSDQALGWGVAVSVLVSIWSAKKGTNALIEGLGIAYDEPDERGFIKTTALSLMVTAVVIVGGIISIGLVALIPMILKMLPITDSLKGLIGFIRWPVAALLIAGFLGWIYRIAPDRRDARWRWLSPGSIVATLLWVLGSILFSWYIDTFGGIDKTYGAFAAVALLMLWFLLTAYAILIGAELNAEIELQTAKDTTIAPDKPLGQRDAYVADHVAPAPVDDPAVDPKSG